MTKNTFLAAAVLSLMFGGCFTQLGTVRDETTTTGDDYSYRTEAYRPGENEVDTSATDTVQSYQQNRRYDYNDNYGYDDWSPRYRWYYSYYYPAYYWPSVSFAMAYNSGWYYSGGYGYYDPWICGTPYVYYPWYPYYYSYYSYYPYPYGYPRYYSGGGSSVVRTNRDFGSTRGGSIRTGSGGRGGQAVSSPLPAGAVSRSSGSTRGSSGSAGTAPARTSGARRGESRDDRSLNREPAVREPVPTGDGAGRKEGETRSSEPRVIILPPPDVRNTDGGNRGESGRGSGSEQPRREGSRRGDRGSSPPSYTPPPSYAPPPSSGGGNRGGGSSGGGNGRGGNSGGGNRGGGGRSGGRG